MVKMAPNNNNDEIASSTSSLSNISKNMISSILPNSPLGGANANYVEGRNTKISPQNSDDCPREGTPSPPTTKASAESYHTIRYAHLSSTEKLDYTTLKSKHRTGRRCYRLNLERPFNIHCEQSPLEYGDIFAPWKKSVRPKTEGPSEYCPPRHLGGGGDVWRRLVSFGQQQLLGRGSDKKSSSNKDGEGEANLGWRKLNPAELRTVQRLGEMNSKGEYAFMTYDLSHVKHHPHLMNKSNNGEDGDNGGGGGGGVITPSTSVDSLDSTDSNPKSAIAKANETARLFRRSELSLRDKAEEAARIEAAEQARLRMERKEKEQAELDALKSVKGAKGVSRRMSKRASFGGKKMMRKLSSSMGSSTGGGGSSSTIRTMSGTGIYEGGAGARRKLVSTQAGMIEKAKDVIDEESDDEYDGEKYDDSKKIKNMSLFIVGEYDVLNDLCLDGGKRLKDSVAISDLDLLLQNEPCPPPNRWVRKTGWGKCNPSSMYAENPPKDFDWEKYLNKDGPVPVNPVPRPVMQVKS